MPTLKQSVKPENTFTKVGNLLNRLTYICIMLNTENMEYNTTRNFLIMREYGRHIQKMVEYLLTIENKEERQRNAYAVIELMGFLNPHFAVYFVTGSLKSNKDGYLQ